MRISPAILVVVALVLYAVASAQTTTSSYSESAAYQPRVQIPKTLDQLQKKTTSVAGTPAQTTASGRRDLTIAAGVFTKDGKFVTDLKPDDFQVFVDGQPASDVSVDNSDDPVHIVLVLDVSPSASFRTDWVKTVAGAVVGSLRSTDRVMVIAFAEKAKIIADWKDDRDKTLNSINKLELDQDGTSLYSMVGELLLNYLADPPGRTAVILVTDGVDTTSRGYDYDNSLWAAESASLPVFTLYMNTSKDGPDLPKGWSPSSVLGSVMLSSRPGWGTPRDMKKEYELGRHYLTDLVSLSGGRPIPTDDMARAVENIKSIPNEMRQRYYLTFPLSNKGKKGARHSITVRVNRPGLIVLAKATELEP